MSIFSFNYKKSVLDELLYFVRKKSNLELKIENKKEESTILKITQKIDNHGIKINSKDIKEILTRVDSHSKDFIQINFKDKQPILITEQFIGFNPLGKRIDGLPEIVTTVDLKEVYKVTFELIHLPSSKSEETKVSWVEVEKLRDMFFAIAEGGVAVGFQLHREKEEFQYLMMSNHQAVSA